MPKIEKPMRAKVTLRDFVNDLMVVSLPRWAWWAIIALAVIAVSLGLSVRL